MARSPKLNWDAGRGKWRVVYQGKKFRFAGGAGKSDREAKKRAEMEWKKTKAQIDLDAESAKPNWSKYQAAIAEWETVLAWCRQNPEAPMTQQMERFATAKIEQLRQRLEADQPEPLDLDDMFNGQFSPGPRRLSQVMDSLNESDQQTHAIPNMPEPEPQPSTLDVERAVWEDRLAAIRNVPHELTVGHQVDRFLAAKSADAGAGQQSKGRSYLLKLYLTHFTDWFGRGTPVVEISGAALGDYRLELLKKIEAGEWSRTTASHRLEGIKTFVRWLWRQEVIPTIPRNMDGKSVDLKISEAKPKVVVFTKHEITRLLGNASDRTRLYVLLCLNCAMTQKDIADLRHDEMDWEAGCIKRKRSKTGGVENVPEVKYELWPETLRLLEQERTKDGVELLRNENDQRLWYDKVVDGKYTKIDNVSCAFGRLCRKLQIKKPLKSLKKTSATLIRSHARYASLEDLYLGHAPRKLSDAHYTLPPASLLDEAITWLGQELGIVAEVSTETT